MAEMYVLGSDLIELTAAASPLLGGRLSGASCLWNYIGNLGSVRQALPSFSRDVAVSADQIVQNRQHCHSAGWRRSVDDWLPFLFNGG